MSDTTRHGVLQGVWLTNTVYEVNIVRGKTVVLIATIDTPFQVVRSICLHEGHLVVHVVVGEARSAIVVESPFAVSATNTEVDVPQQQSAARLGLVVSVVVRHLQQKVLVVVGETKIDFVVRVCVIIGGSV